VFLDFIQSRLDEAGMIPGLGEVFDLINAGISLLRGDCTGAFLSLAAAVPVAGWLASGGRLARRARACRAFCFEAGTGVETPDGLRPIEDLALGDLVLAQDERTGELTWRPVTALHTRPDQPLLELSLAGPDATDTLGVTPEHPFWVPGAGWTQAADLHPGDLVASASGAPLTVTSLTSLGRRVTVHNLTVATDRSYFVGNTSAFVHNCVDLTGHRRAHILNRHRAGAGKPGKTEFPSSWNDDHIIHNVSDVASDPRALRGTGKWDSPHAIGTRDGIDIRVDFYPPGHPLHAGKISTAYPLNVPPNPK
jgi:hypothetical protein